MTLQDWQRDESKAILLKELLSQPIMVEVLNVAVFTELPKVVPIHQGVDHSLELALKQSHQAGWHDCLRFIKSTLTATPEPPKQPLTTRTLDKSQ